jgi:hypothetical protein
MLAILRRGLVLGVAGALIGLAALAAGCGGGGDEEPTTETAAQGTTPAGGEDDGEAPAAEPLGPAEAKESIDEAEQRIADAVASDDCDTVNELNPISRPSLNTPERCRYMRRLDRLEATGAEEYGNAGAVIDYKSGARTLGAVLVRDSDGLFHVAFVNQFNEGESVGTPYAHEFDKAARLALKSLETKDCERYLEVVWRRTGRGAAGKEVACEYVEQNPVANLLEAQPGAKYERAGGNSTYAFYTLSTPPVNLTFVFARQSDQGAPPKAPPLPKDAGEYVLVDIYRTNDRLPGE